MEKILDSYRDIVSEENLWQAWLKYRGGKRHRAGVRIFERYLESELLLLHKILTDRTYQHGPYRIFTVHDPKRRVISAPEPRDQIVHQAIWNILFPFFNRRFSPAVCSCRPLYGTHRAICMIQTIIRRFGTRGQVYALHIDIVKFFDSIRHDVLLSRLATWIDCADTLELLKKIIGSYDSGRRSRGDDSRTRRGVPLGSLTSQLFCNLMLMPLDWQIENGEYGRIYVRYADDLLFFSPIFYDLQRLEWNIKSRLRNYGFESRAKISRVDGFEALGARVFRDGRSLRRSTRIRSMKKLHTMVGMEACGHISTHGLEQAFQSWRGLDPSDSRWTERLIRITSTYENS